MRLASPAICLVLLVSTTVLTGSAHAGPALDDAATKRPASTTDEPDCAASPGDPRCPAPGDASEVEYGVGVRLRSVWVPKALLELFVERSAGGSQNFGFGVDLSRRRGSTELQIGLEYERINVGQGVWINSGDNVAAGDEADYVLGPDSTTGSGKQFGWFTLEFTFLNHAEITKWLAVRYGGGLGLGVLIGEIDHYNIICAAGATTAAPEPGCVPMRFNGTGAYSEGQATLVKYDLPPVFPVVNAIIGLQLRASERVTINIEGGIRTIPFLGTSASVFF
jgi:hypothetical protein